MSNFNNTENLIFEEFLVAFLNGTSLFDMRTFLSSFKLGCLFWLIGYLEEWDKKFQFVKFFELFLLFVVLIKESIYRMESISLLVE